MGNPHHCILSPSARLHRMLSAILASSNRDAKRAVTLIINAAHKSLLKLKTSVKKDR